MKRTTTSIYENYETRITFSSREDYERAAASLRVMEENCFDLGEDDNATRFAAMTYSEFSKCLEAEGLPQEIKAEVARACYATYLDAFNGKPLKLHITCELLQEDTEK
nr:MAG: hypothetical protein [Bacteriophage sp.]